MLPEHVRRKRPSSGQSHDPAQADVPGVRNVSITCQQNPETSRGLAPFTAVVFGVQPTFFSRVLREVWLRGATAKRWGTKGGNKFLSLAQKMSKEVVSDVEVPGARDARK